jgi:serine/threonine-protein kinase RsbW
MPPAEHRSFTGAMSEVIATAQWLDGIAERNGLPSDAVFALHICSEEILTNILRHSGSSGPRIEVSLAILSDRIELIVEDDGAPFDVTQAVPRKIEGDILTVEPGGLGVQLIQQFASSLEYGRGGLGNRLLVTIFYSPDGDSELAKLSHHV